MSQLEYDVLILGQIYDHFSSWCYVITTLKSANMGNASNLQDHKRKPTLLRHIFFFFIEVKLMVWGLYCCKEDGWIDY